MTDATLTLQDIADLAHVRRPVVSMWRRRLRVRGVEIPFPVPMQSADGIERFARDEVVAWLEATGRGNNVDTRQDAPALSAPAGINIEDVVVLLCLHALTGEELAGLSSHQLVAIAQQADPNDELLLSEVCELVDAAALQRYVDDLVEASFGLGDALARVQSGRLRREAAERGLSAGVLELLRAVADACRLHLNGDGTALALLGEQPLAAKINVGFAGLLLDDEDSTSRAQRRRAQLQGVEVLDVAPATVRVLSVVGMEPVTALDTVDDLALRLGPSDIGIVLGPASVLCDRLIGETEWRRGQTLRAGVLAMAIRLSRGLWKGAHRQSLALWVLQGGRSAQSLYMADLDGLHVDLTDFAADVSAALELTDKRAYRYARHTDLAPVLAGTVPVVPRGVRAPQLGGAASTSHLDHIHTASLLTSQSVAGYDVAVASAPAQIVLRQRSLRELADGGHLIVRRGSRIDAAHSSDAGTVRVLAADGRMDHIRFDPLDAERQYPRALRTEPGDVIFIHQPQPTARVDEMGGAVVASPSRIMRLQPTAPIRPHGLAALINELAIPGTEWETWTVPDLPSVESSALEAALRDATSHLCNLREHEQAVRELIKGLIQGLAAGSVTIDPTITQKAG